MDEKEIQGIKALAAKVTEARPEEALRIISEDALIARAETSERFDAVEQKISAIDLKIIGIFFFLTVLIVPMYLILLKNNRNDSTPEHPGHKEQKP